MFVNKNKFSLNKKIKKAYTLPEVIVATFISVIIISFIFVFLSNIIEGISDTNNEVKILSSFYDFTNKLNNYSNVYITWWILVDNSVWSDIFLMEDISWETWILFWPVKLYDSRLSTDNTIYEDKWIWFRKISSTEMIEIKSDVNQVYNYVFQKDQIFSDLKIQDMILVEYNSWYIYDLSLIVDLGFQVSLIWQLRQDLPKDTLRKYNINF